MRTYKFAKLSKAAKETARDWFREASAQDDYWEYTYEDANTWLGYLGFEHVQIYHRGFSCQGDGASFTGDWHANRMQIPEAIEHCSGDSDSSKTAQDIAARIAAISLIHKGMSASLDIAPGSRSYHEYSIGIVYGEAYPRLDNHGRQLRQDFRWCSQAGGSEERLQATYPGIRARPCVRVNHGN